MALPPDDRTPLALAIAWASAATIIALEMTIPALLGFGLDRWLDIPVVFTAAGAIAGLVLGMLHLLRLATPGERSTSSKTSAQPPTGQNIRKPDATNPDRSTDK